MSAPTPHNQALPGQFAKTVLMPGDPLRAKHVAEQFLENPELVNQVRGALGYTGTYQGKRVSVMASGMGAASIGIYSYELYAFYGVQSIIRIGSAGGLQPELNLGDIVIGIAASTDCGYAAHLKLPGQIAPAADFGLAMEAMRVAKERNLRALAGTLLTAEAFYCDSAILKQWADVGTLAVEMEAAALYINAALLKKKALAVCTISDHIFSGGSYTALERQTRLNEMIELALAIAEE